MVDLKLRNLNPLAYVTIISLMSLVFTGLVYISLQLTLIETRNVVNQVDETSEITNRVLQTGNRTGQIIDELRTTQRIVEESRQNQTERLLPIFFRQFNQTDDISDLVQNLSEILAQQRFTEKEIRDNQVQMTFDIDRMAAAIDNLTEIVSQLR